MRDLAQQPPLLRGIADSLLATDGYKSAVREVVLIAGAYFAYMFVRNSLVSEVEVLGFENASSLISFEQASGAFWEASWQSWALEHGGAWVMQLFNYLYIVTYFPIIAVTAVFFYWKRRERYFYYRALILLTFVAALIIFASFPLAPPRLVEGFGFVDGIAVYGPGWYASRETASYYNIYAAMPSLHFSWTFIFGFLFWNTGPKVLKLLGVLYPTVTFFAIIITGNHYIADAVVGIAMVAVVFVLFEGWRRREWILAKIPQSRQGRRTAAAGSGFERSRRALS